MRVVANSDYETGRRLPRSAALGCHAIAPSSVRSEAKRCDKLLPHLSHREPKFSKNGMAYDCLRRVLQSVGVSSVAGRRIFTRSARPPDFPESSGSLSEVLVNTSLDVERSTVLTPVTPIGEARLGHNRCALPG
jgi:hypothetical protein